MVNIYVGNLAWAVTEEDLRAAFEPYGTVELASVIVDRLTGKSRGFGFVEMPNEAEARAAIAALHDFELKERKMLVREARPKGDAPRQSRQQTSSEQ